MVVLSRHHAGERLDIRDPAAIHDLLRRVRPDAVVHTAAGRDRNDWPSTADGAANVAVAAARLGVRLVHVSSDAIFSGRDPVYSEDAEPDPVYRYGCAKAAAETAVRATARTGPAVGAGCVTGSSSSAGPSRGEPTTSAAISTTRTFASCDSRDR